MNPGTEKRRSKDVLTVLGMLCIRPKWRAKFFLNPRERAQELVGRLSDEELKQIDNLAGKGARPNGMTKRDFVSRASSAFESVCASYDCPDPPCPPDPDSF